MVLRVVIQGIAGGDRELLERQTSDLAGDVLVSGVANILRSYHPSLENGAWASGVSNQLSASDSHLAVEPILHRPRLDYQQAPLMNQQDSQGIMTPTRTAAIAPAIRANVRMSLTLSMPAPYPSRAGYRRGRGGAPRVPTCSLGGSRPAPCTVGRGQRPCRSGRGLGEAVGF